MLCVILKRRSSESEVDVIRGVLYRLLCKAALTTETEQRKTNPKQCFVSDAVLFCFGCKSRFTYVDVGIEATVCAHGPYRSRECETILFRACFRVFSFSFKGISSYAVSRRLHPQKKPGCAHFLKVQKQKTSKFH